MFRKFLTSIFLIIATSFILCSCFQKEVVVSIPKTELDEYEIQMSKEQESKINEVVTSNEKMSTEEKEKVMYDLLELGAGDFLEYNQNLYEVKENGYMYNYDTMEKIPITVDDFLDLAITELKSKAIDVNERQGDDWDYINSALNLPDFGNDYKEAFYNDGTFHYNELIGVFNNDEERESAYNEFIKQPTITEKAKYLRALIGRKNDTYANKKDNEKIVKDYINNMISLIYGNDRDKAEIKYYEYKSNENDEITIAYIIGDIITPEKNVIYYVEDYVKGKIINNKLERDLDPIYSDFYDSPEYVVNAPFLIQSSIDIGKINMGIQLDDIIEVKKIPEIENMWTLECEYGERNVYYGDLLYDNKSIYILNGLENFPNMNVDDLKSNITKELPIYRKLVVVNDNFDKLYQATDRNN